VTHIPPLHTLVAFLVNTVWRSWHHITGEWGHVFVTSSCADPLLSGFNYIKF